MCPNLSRRPLPSHARVHWVPETVCWAAPGLMPPEGAAREQPDCDEPNHKSGRHSRQLAGLLRAKSAALWAFPACWPGQVLSAVVPSPPSDAPAMPQDPRNTPAISVLSVVPGKPRLLEHLNCENHLCSGRPRGRQDDTGRASENSDSDLQNVLCLYLKSPPEPDSTLEMLLHGDLASDTACG